MPREDERDDVEVSRLLAGAAKAIAKVRYCWLLTETGTGSANARAAARKPALSKSARPIHLDWYV